MNNYNLKTRFLEINRVKSLILLVVAFLVLTVSINISLATDEPSDDFTQTITLKPGWSIFSPKHVVQSHQFSIAETANNFTVQLLDPTSISMWNTMAGIGQTEFSPLYGYFINNKTNVNQTLTLTYKKTLNPSQRIFSRNLSSGWNSIGFADPNTEISYAVSGEAYRTNEEYLDFIKNNGDYLYFFDFTDGNSDRNSLSVETNWRKVFKAQINNLKKIVGNKGYGIYIANNTTAKHEGYQNAGLFNVSKKDIHDLKADNSNQKIASFDATIFNDRVEISSLEICSDKNLQNASLKINNEDIITNFFLNPCANLDFSANPIIFQPYDNNHTTKTFDIFADVPTNVTGSLIKITISGNNNAKGTVVNNTFNFPSNEIELLAFMENFDMGDNSFLDIAGHWAQEYIEELVDMGYISTDHYYFYPDNNINRAELVKIAIEASGGIIPDLVPQTPTFTDVPKDAWFYEYVETAYALDIIGGYANGTFGPSDPVIRGQALKIFINALGVPTKLNPPTVFTDVPMNNAYYNFVTTAYNQCITEGKEDGTFGIDDQITRGEMAKYLVKSMSPGCGNDPVDPPNPPEPQNPTLELSISADNPKSSIYPLNGTNLPYLVLDLTAGEGGNVDVTSLTVSLHGLGSRLNYEEVKVFDGFKQIGFGASFSDITNTATINMSSEPVFVTAGTTKSITIVADINPDSSVAGSANYFSIDSVIDIAVYDSDSGIPVSVAGDFPLKGNIMTIGVVNVGSLSFVEKETINNNVTIGDYQVPITNFEITASNVEDIKIKAIKLTQKGSSSINDIEKMSLWYGDAQIGENVVKLNNNKEVLFDLTGMPVGGWIFNKGDSKTLSVKANIINGLGSTVAFEIDEPNTDIIAEGLTYRFNVAVGNWCNTANCGGVDTGFVNIEAGSLNFSFNSTAREVAPGNNDVEFGILNIVNNGEPVNIKEFNLISKVTGGNTDTLDDVKFVDTSTGFVISGPEDMPAGSSSVTKRFADNFMIDSGETLSLQLLADINSNALEGAKYHFELDINSVQYQGITSGYNFTCGVGNADCRPATNPRTQDYTIQFPSITFTNKALASQTYATLSSDITLWHGKVSASSAEDIIIRDLLFTQKTESALDGDMNNIRNLSLYTKRGSNTILQESWVNLVNGSSDNGYARFSSLNEDGSSGIGIAAGEEIEIILKGNVSPTLIDSDSDGIINTTFTLDVSEVEVENLNGDAASVKNTTDITANTMTLVESGNLKVTLKQSQTPDPMILVAGTNNVEVGVFEFDANVEDANIEDLTVLIGAVNTTVTLIGGDVANDEDAIYSVALYDTTSGMPILRGDGSNAETTNIDANNKALLSNLDLVINKDENKLISVYVSLNDIAITDIAQSGMTFNTALSFNEGSADFDIWGNTSGYSYETVGALGSGKQIETNDGTANAEKTTNGGNMYVLNNKLVVSRSSNQPTTLSTGTKESLKFTLTPSGDGATYFGGVKVDIQEFDSDHGVSSDLNVTAVDLYSGSNLIGNGIQNGNEWTIDLLASAPNTQINGDWYDAISVSGETYTIKVAVDGVGVDDEITTLIDVNIQEIANASADIDDDDIMWRDYGTDGTDGIDIDWIDLGSDTTTSVITNTIRN